MPLYDKPIWQLLEEALADVPHTFTTDELLEWFEAHYPLIKPASLRVYLAGMSVNSRSRHHYPYLEDHGVLYKVDRTRYTRYDTNVHGQFDPEGRSVGQQEELDDEGTGDQILSQEQSEFAMELHLEDFMQENWTQIDFGRPLKIWTDADGLLGRQYPSGVGPIDFLCQDTQSGDFVVVELKKGKTIDSVLGQTQRYMGWVARNLATDGQKVHGIIIASQIDEKLQYGLAVTVNMSARRYRVEFKLEEPESPFDR
jgi:hypothetical protein